MKLRHFFLAVLCFALISGCQKAEESSRFIMPDVVVAIAPFTQPTQTSELLSGFIPEGQKEITDKKLAELDALFHSKLHSDKHKLVFLSQADIDSPMAKDERGRRNALVTWAERAARAGAAMIVVPQIIELQERVGGEAGVISAASVNEDFYLIDARKPYALLQRSHFAEEQQSLASDLTKIGSFFRRGGKWVSDLELAAEGMDKAVKELGL
ncbi:hypothetical protein [Mailhella sp.]